MKTLMRSAAACCALIGLAATVPAMAGDAAKTFSPKEITAFVAAGAGGGTDNFARQIQPRLKEIFDTNVVVVNLPSASGVMAHQRTATGKANGEAIDFASSTIITSLAAGQNPIGLDMLTPVARMQSDVLTLMVNPKKYDSLEAFMTYAKENPGEVIIGGTHAASPDGMAFLAFKDASGLDMQFIPYDEEGSVAANVMSGNIDGLFNEISSSLGYIESGHMKPILVLADKRLADFPDVPTTVENGWDITFGNERGVFINAKTDPAIIAAYENALREVYDSEAYKIYEKKAQLHYREGWLGSKDYRAALEANLEQFTRLLAESKQ